MKGVRVCEEHDIGKIFFKKHEGGNFGENNRGGLFYMVMTNTWSGTSGVFEARKSDRVPSW